MSKSVPFSGRTGVVFSVDKQDVTLSAVVQNPVDYAWYTNISWSGGAIRGLRITSGVNLVAQFPNCPLVNLYAINKREPSTDIDALVDLMLVIVTGEE